MPAEPTPAERLFPGRLAISPTEFFAAVGLSKTAGWRAIWRGDIPSRRLGGRVVIPLDALDAWLAGRPTPHPAAPPRPAAGDFDGPLLTEAQALASAAAQVSARLKPILDRVDARLAAEAAGREGGP